MTSTINLLVTGAQGQLGRSLADALIRYPQIQAYLTDVSELDITQPTHIATYVETHRIDCIINCAAYTAVDAAEDDVSLCHQLNATAPAFLAQAMAQRGGSLIQVSTDYVFSGDACTPYTEDMPTAPQSVYGRTKLQGEEQALQACPRTAVVRTAWLCSPYGKNFVKTMLALGQQGKELRVVCDQIGTPTFAADLAEALLTMVQQGVQPGIYHYTNEGVASWYDFAQAVHRLSGITQALITPVTTEAYPTRARRPHYSVLDKQKIKQTYGLSIPWWHDSLKDCLHILSEQNDA